MSISKFFQQENSFEELNLDEQLELVESKLKDVGYKKYIQKLKNEDFSYFKTYFSEDGEEKKYQIGVLFYDFRKALYFEPCITAQYWCLLFDSDGRVDLTVSKDISLEKFESMSDDFYNSMKSHIE